jgi:hypothetical protein
MRSIYGLLLILTTSLLMPSLASAAKVEIYLLDKLDGNLNHYCIDMQGFQERADVNGNLQTHTCYSYQGQLAVDQTMDTMNIDKGMLKVDAFNVCATLHGTVAGSTIGVTECTGANEQKFELSANGEIRPTAAPTMCLTSGPSSWAGGRNGDSPHQIRTLNLQPCSDEAMVYQRWGTREEMTD